MANMIKIDGLTHKARTNPEWFTRAMFSGVLVESGKVRVLTGITGEETLNQIDLENKILQIDGLDCAWTPNQVLKLSEKLARVKTYKINMEQCLTTLENRISAFVFRAGANDIDWPEGLEEQSLVLIAIGLNREIETMIVGGNSAVDPNEFDGLFTLLRKSGSDAIKLAGAVLTEDNILDAIAAVYRAIPTAVLKNRNGGGINIFYDYEAERLVRLALNNLVEGDKVVKNYSVNDSDPRNPVIHYMGMELVAVLGAGENEIVAIDANNAFLLTDLESDLDDIRMGQFAEPNEDMVWIKGRLRLGFVVPFEEEAVIWSPAITQAQGAGTYPNDLILRPVNLVFAAGGESKVFNVVTTDEDAEIVLGAAPAGFTVTKGATAAGITQVTVVATSNEGNLRPRVGQIVVSIEGTDRSATLMLDQHSEDVPDVTE